MTETDLLESLRELRRRAYVAMAGSDLPGSANDGTARTEREVLLDEAAEYLNDWRRWCQQRREAA
jgi:hypothetical protein